MSSKFRTDSYPYKVYTALVTQTGGGTESYINSGTLTIGRTYAIKENSPGMDFTNVGAPSNNVNTKFVATGENPNSWGTGSLQTLAYVEGAPVVKILENTMSRVVDSVMQNIIWEYVAAGRYKASLKGAFPYNKTFCQGTLLLNSDGAGIRTIATFIVEEAGDDYVTLISSNEFESSKNDMLSNTPIEIRVYQ